MRIRGRTRSRAQPPGVELVSQRADDVAHRFACVPRRDELEDAGYDRLGQATSGPPDVVGLALLEGAESGEQPRGDELLPYCETFPV